MDRIEQLNPGGAAAVAISTAQQTGMIGERIVATAVAVCGRLLGPRMRALILTGSWAREEATVVGAASGWRVLGDAEFLVILRDGRPPAAGWKALAAEIASALAAGGLICPVSVSGAGSRYLRSLPPHIYGCELRQAGRVVAGEAGILAEIPAFTASAIPLEDAWRLLSNRMIEQLEIAASLPPNGPESGAALPSALAYATVKLYLDMAASYLVFRDAFTSGYGARRHVLNALAMFPTFEEPGAPLEPPFAISEFACEVDRCTDWKLGDEAWPTHLPWSYWNAAAAIAVRLWHWELRGMGAAGVDAELWRRFAAHQPLRGRWRGWLQAAREQGGRGSLRQLRHWCRIAPQASPRWWVYRAAAALYSQLPGLLRGEQLSPAVSADLNRCLPVPAARIEGWRSLAQAIAWNFHSFVERTRS